MNQDQFDAVMDTLVATWPAWKPNPATFAVAEHLLADLEFEHAEAAVLALAVEHPEFPPGVGAVRARAVRLADPDPTPDAGEAWAEVRVQLGRVGYLGRPSWSHPAIGCAVDSLGGWAALCRSSTDMADRAHFLRIYETVADRRQRERQLPPAVAALVASAGQLKAGAQPVGIGS